MCVCLQFNNKTFGAQLIFYTYSNSEDIFYNRENISNREIINTKPPQSDYLILAGRSNSVASRHPAIHF